MVEHHLDKLGGLRRHFGVHLPTGFHQLVRCAVRQRVAVREEVGVVVYLEILDTDAFCLTALDFVVDRHNLLDDLAAEVGNLLRTVAVAAAQQVSHLYIVGKTQTVCLLGAVFDQTVIDVIKLRLMLVKKAAVCLCSGFAHRTVRALLVRTQLSQIADLAVKLDFSAGAQLLVLLNQLVFLLNQWNQLGRKALEGDFDVFEHQRAKLLLQLLAERRGNQSLVKLLELFVEHRSHLLVVLFLLAVKWVAGVHSVADGANLNVGGQLDAQLLQLFDDLNLLGGACSLLKAFSQLGDGFHQLWIIGTLIGKFRKFHGVLLLYEK